MPNPEALAEIDRHLAEAERLANAYAASAIEYESPSQLHGEMTRRAELVAKIFQARFGIECWKPIAPFDVEREKVREHNRPGVIRADSGTPAILRA